MKTPPSSGMKSSANPTSGRRPGFSRSSNHSRVSFQPSNGDSMRAIVTGQVGVDKGPYLEAVQQLATKNGIDLKVCHVGKMMYEEAPDVPHGRILNPPISRLNTLRRA